jgi:hypothetical protein
MMVRSERERRMKIESIGMLFSECTMQLLDSVDRHTIYDSFNFIKIPIARSFSNTKSEKIFCYMCTGNFGLCPGKVVGKGNFLLKFELGFLFLG